MKKILSLLMAVIITVCMLSACGSTREEQVAVYTVKEKFNSSAVNQWKTLYLLDEDNYTLTVYALDSQDATIVTADFYMSGKYITNEDGSVTLQAGYGFARVRNGDIPVEIPVQPDANGDQSSMYYSVMGQFDTFILNKDGTWTGA